MKKPVYLFHEGHLDDKALLGNKGANLCEMTRLGLPVPPGFVITTKACVEFFKRGSRFPENLQEEYLKALRYVETQTGQEFCNPARPLLLSVRSGASVSMPGMMDTVLNLGMNDAIVEGMIRQTHNSRFVYDTYRRFIQMFAEVVLGKDRHAYERILSDYKQTHRYESDLELDAQDLKSIVEKFKNVAEVPSDPHTQLRMAIEAVFSSWYTLRAVRYREYNDIPNDLGTAVNVQAMVFGNFGRSSGTGVAFTRNPATGEHVFYGEYLEQAEGEDVVSGVRTPKSLDQLSEQMPEMYTQLYEIQQKLERHYHDMQDLEFTIQEGKLYILQTRTGKRTAKAAVRIAIEMVREGLITEKDALLRVDAEQMNYFLHPMIDPEAPQTVIAQGLPASPGVAQGKVVFSADEAEDLAAQGEKVVLVRHETTPEDIHGMKAAQGILTKLGGMTSHAAVVARGMGKCCVAGCDELIIDYDQERVRTRQHVIKKMDLITVDGSSGKVMLGKVATIEAHADQDFQTLLHWADRYRHLHIRANAETPEDAQKACDLGAEGIGLCRTEHMFFAAERIDTMRSMILSETQKERQMYLGRLFEFQKADMQDLFKVMTGHPVTIRLLDPPLHEFLPQNKTDIQALANRLGRGYDKVKQRIEALFEVNPMLGFRGCRIALVYPEITRMQTKAVITAALEAQEEGAQVYPEIMVPLVATARELRFIRQEIETTANRVFEEYKASVAYRIGTMMEVPRACLRADTLAPLAEFMSFGTNDLTQMTFGFSRDDVGKFLPAYLEHETLKNDPFVILDQRGVGELIRLAIGKSRPINPNMEYGICGEHGGNARSIRFCHHVGFHYVSCSPYRVPVARIAAAQASIETMKKQLHPKG